MQELENILKELKEVFKQHIVKELNGDGTIDKYSLNPWHTWKDIEEVIRKHMNDGWISVDERLPEKPKENPVFDGKKLELYLVDIGANYPLRAFWNGQKFTDGWSVLNVKAWQPLSKRYRPERNCEIE